MRNVWVLFVISFSYNKWNKNYLFILSFITKNAILPNSIVNCLLLFLLVVFPELALFSGRHCSATIFLSFFNYFIIKIFKAVLTKKILSFSNVFFLNLLILPLQKQQIYIFPNNYGIANGMYATAAIFRSLCCAFFFFFHIIFVGYSTLQMVPITSTLFFLFRRTMSWALIRIQPTNLLCRYRYCLILVNESFHFRFYFHVGGSCFWASGPFVLAARLSKLRTWIPHYSIWRWLLHLCSLSSHTTRTLFNISEISHSIFFFACWLESLILFSFPETIFKQIFPGSE